MGSAAKDLLSHETVVTCCSMLGFPYPRSPDFGAQVDFDADRRASIILPWPRPARPRHGTAPTARPDRRGHPPSQEGHTSRPTTTETPTDRVRGARVPRL